MLTDFGSEFELVGKLNSRIGLNNGNPQLSLNHYRFSIVVQRCNFRESMLGCSTALKLAPHFTRINKFCCNVLKI